MKTTPHPTQTSESAKASHKQASGSIRQVLLTRENHRMHWVGNGFPVRTLFDYNQLGRELSPFLLLDHAAPHRFPPGDERRGVGAHPHRGFETVTIAYQGEVEHRDSTGAGGRIGPGDVQWMTAGRGIVHEEFHSRDFTQSGGTFEMIQLWVNLPSRHKSAAPAYQTLMKSQIPTVQLPGKSGSLRVIAGEFEGARGPARTFTPIQLWDVQLDARQEVILPFREGDTAALVLLKGDLTVNLETPLSEGGLIVFKREGQQIHLQSGKHAHILILSGEPIDEPIVGSGPFVMNSQSEIQQAFMDYQKGSMGFLE